MEIINAGKKVENCDEAIRLSHQHILTEPALSNAGITNFSGSVNITAATATPAERIAIISVVVGVRDTDTPVDVTAIDLGGITPTLISQKSITSTGAGSNGQNNQYIYYVKESDLATLGATATLTIDTNPDLQGGTFGGLLARVNFYDGINQAAPIFAFGQSCEAGAAANPWTQTVPSSDLGITHWTYSKAAGINDSINAPNIVDGLVQASGLAIGTAYQEGSVTDPHELEVTQLAGTLKGIITTGVHLTSSCLEVPSACNCSITVESADLFEYRDVVLLDNTSLSSLELDEDWVTVETRTSDSTTSIRLKRKIGTYVSNVTIN